MQGASKALANSLEQYYEIGFCHDCLGLQCLSEEELACHLAAFVTGLSGRMRFLIGKAIWQNSVLIAG